MSRLVVRAFGVSLDGYGAGVEQSLSNPLGVGGEGLHNWFFPTRTFQRMVGKDDGTTGPDDDLAAKSLSGLGAWIMGRNMFTHERGPWKFDWKGWWGDEPPYHCDVYVLSHHARPSLEHGGTTFHFVTEGIETALGRARASAGGKDIRVGGGVSTVRAYLTAGLIDEMHLVLSPVLLGRGEAFWAGIDLPALGYGVAETVRTEAATHVFIRRDGS